MNSIRRVSLWKEVERLSLEYTNSQDTAGRTRVYLTVSFDSYKKISTENMYYDKFGEGRIYYKYLTPRAILGATSEEILDLGRYKEADTYIRENIFCFSPACPLSEHFNLDFIIKFFISINKRFM